MNNSFLCRYLFPPKIDKNITVVVIKFNLIKLSIANIIAKIYVVLFIYLLIVIITCNNPILQYIIYNLFSLVHTL